MVLAVHVVMSMYGFWLPNDPRGSWSKFVGNDDLFRAAGKATKCYTRQSRAAVSHDVAARENAKETLKYTPVLLNGEQARAVARGFGRIEHPIYACAIMPEHVHLVIGRTTIPAKEVAEQLKVEAESQIKAEEIFPYCETIWAKGCWQSFLDTPKAVRAAIKYVEQNPVKAGYKHQVWSFVIKPPFIRD